MSDFIEAMTTALKNHRSSITELNLMLLWFWSGFLYWDITGKSEVLVFSFFAAGVYKLGTACEAESERLQEKIDAMRRGDD